MKTEKTTAQDADTNAESKTALAPTASAQTSPWPVFWVASIATFLVSLDTTMLFAAFDPLRHAFPTATSADISWVLNAYTVVYATMLIPAGGLADTHGRKRVFLMGVALFLTASAACGLAGNVSWLTAARVLQAIGAALLTPASLSIVLAAFPQNKRAVVVSLWGAVGGLAAAVGPSAGSYVIDHFGWPWAFYINLPIGGFALWRGASLITESVPSSERRRVDVVGMALLMLAVGAITLAIVEFEAPNWSSTELTAMGVTGLMASLVFVAWARRAANPLVDLALFQHRTYRYINLATLTFGTAFSMMFLTFFFYVMNIWHYSLPQAGLAVTPGPLMVMPTAIVTGRLATRLGHRPFLVGGSLLYALSSLWFLIVPGLESNYLLHWLPGLIMSGIAVGLVLPSLSAAAVNRLPIAHYAVGSAVALLGHATLQRADFNALYLLHGALALLTGLLCLPVDTRPQNSKS